MVPVDYTANALIASAWDIFNKQGMIGYIYTNICK